jgi:hypothetical protein
VDARAIIAKRNKKLTINPSMATNLLALALSIDIEYSHVHVAEGRLP